MTRDLYANGSWMKLGDAARALGVSEITLRRKVKAGKISYEVRDGKYYVYLLNDPVTGRFVEVGPQPGAEASPVLPQIHEPLSSPLQGYEDEICVLRQALEQKENVIKSLRRNLEDQQTLIALLEQTISTLANGRETPPPNARHGARRNHVGRAV